MEEELIRKIYQLKQINEQNRINKLNCLKQNLDKLYNGPTTQQKTIIGNTQGTSFQKTKTKCIW